jgi:hypothetical protein
MAYLWFSIYRNVLGRRSSSVLWWHGHSWDLNRIINRDDEMIAGRPLTTRPHTLRRRRRRLSARARGMRCGMVDFDVARTAAGTAPTAVRSAPIATRH